MDSPYDSFALFYDRYWAPPHLEWQRPALDRLLFSTLSPGAHVLDLCCGTGNLARQLVSRGYLVTGVDGSDKMLRIARENVPEAVFLHADAANFKLDRQVDAAVCAFDSLNHLLQPEQLKGAFRAVFAAVKPGGCFVFDINTPGAYGEMWNRSACEVESDHAFFLRGEFDPRTRTGRTQITMFRLQEAAWQRADVEIHQRPWEVPETGVMLHAAGFSDIQSYKAHEELGMSGHYGIGRVYVRACRNSNEPNA